MKKITLHIFAILAFAFSWQAHAQFTESFETDIPSTWTIINGGGANGWVFNLGPSGGAQDGTGVASLTYNATAHDDYLITPAITVVDNINDRLSFFVKSSSSSYLEPYEVLLSTTDATVGAFTTVLQASSEAPNAWTKLTFNLSTYSGQTVYVALRATGTNELYLYADNYVNDAFPTCTFGVVNTPTLIDDCVASQFTVEVDFTTIGDATGVSDGTTIFPIAGTMATAGPFVIGTTPTLTVVHSDSACDFSLGTFATGCAIPGEVCENPIIIGALPYATTDNTSNYEDDYSGVPGTGCGATSSYLNGDDVVYSYTATSDTSVNISMTPTATYSGIFVYTDCADIGANCVAGVGNSGTSIRTFDLAVANGTTYYIVISTWANPQSTAYTLNIVENTCTAATVNYVITDDCDVSGGFYIDVNISNLGSATALTISDDQGSAPQALTAVGTVSFGPFVNGTDVVITILDDNDANCTIVSSVLTQTVCPPSNTNCATAEAITVGLGICGPTVTGNNTGATDSGEGTPSCGNYSGGDIWYSFVVPANRNQVTVELGTTAFSTTKMAVYDTSMTCGSLVEIFCDNLYTTKTVTSLTAGDTYLLRLYDWGNDDFGEVTFCISTLASCPAPTGIVVTNRATTSADLNWTENGTATSWDIEWGATGFTATGNPTIDDTAIKPYGFTGLTASTAYDFYVRSDCGGGDVSAWVGPFTFSTTDLPPACGGNFYDEGGIAGDYSNNSNITTTICPDLPGDTVNVNFTFFSTENRGSTDCWDGLTIHDGPDATAATIDPPGGGTKWCWDRDDATPGGTGDLQGMTITSTDPSGCLTFVFTSDSSGLREGWEANVTCTALSLQEFGLTGFTYFPNPVTNSLSLRGVQNIQNVAVYNMLGQEVLRTAPNNPASDVDMSNLQTGAYFVKVTIENTTKTIRIIKN